MNGYRAKDVPMRTIFLIGFAVLMSVTGWLTWKAEGASDRSLQNEVRIEAVHKVLSRIEIRLARMETKLDEILDGRKACPTEPSASAARWSSTTRAPAMSRAGSGAPRPHRGN